MPNTFFNFMVAPVMGWLTLLSVLLVAHLVRLEFIERRRNRRLDEKRASLRFGEPLRSKVPRPLAMRHIANVNASLSRGSETGQNFQKCDRQAGWNFSSAGLN